MSIEITNWLRGLGLEQYAPLVGREEELDLLLRRWAQAKSGEGRIVLLSAEAGIGKSRLAEALVERIAAEKPGLLRYFCSPHHQDSALFPIISQLERAAGFMRDDTPAAQLEKLAAVFGDSAAASDDLALIAELLSLPTKPPSSTLELSPQRKKELTFEALLRQLEALARRQAVLMVFEDLHWIDPTTRELFDRAIVRIEDLPVLLIATIRPDFASPWTGQPHVTMLSLSRLGRRDGAALVRQLVAKATAFPPEIIEEIIERTDGVPLFLEEVTKLALDATISNTAGGSTALLPGTRLAVPPTLRASLMARLDRLGPVAREVAQIGAAIGRDFPDELLLAASQRGEAETRGARRPGRGWTGIPARRPACDRISVQARAGPGHGIRHLIARPAASAARAYCQSNTRTISGNHRTVARNSRSSPDRRGRTRQRRHLLAGGRASCVGALGQHRSSRASRARHCRIERVDGNAGAPPAGIGFAIGARSGAAVDPRVRRSRSQAPVPARRGTGGSAWR